MWAVVLTMFLALWGCATLVQPTDTAKFYRRDIQLQFGGRSFEGTAVLPRQGSYDLVLKPKSDMDLLFIRSCHRELVAEKASGGGLFSKNEYKYLYQPVESIEANGVCPLKVDALESGSNQYSGFS